MVITHLDDGFGETSITNDTHLRTIINDYCCSLVSSGSSLWPVNTAQWISQNRICIGLFAHMCPSHGCQVYFLGTGDLRRFNICVEVMAKCVHKLYSYVFIIVVNFKLVFSLISCSSMHFMITPKANIYNLLRWYTYPTSFIHENRPRSQTANLFESMGALHFRYLTTHRIPSHRTGKHQVAHSQHSDHGPPNKKKPGAS